jgi:hypothetical protein
MTTHVLPKPTPKTAAKPKQSKGAKVLSQDPKSRRPVDFQKK